MVVLLNSILFEVVLVIFAFVVGAVVVVSDVKAYVDSVMKSWADKWESGEISDDEYFANCPQGYECWSCGYCGKWTGNFK